MLGTGRRQCKDSAVSLSFERFLDRAASLAPAEGRRDEERHEFNPHVDTQTTTYSIGIADIKDWWVDTAIREQTAKPSQAVVAQRHQVRAICQN
jgi:hypothetical protein